MARLALALLVLCALSSRASAWLRESFEDAEVVARSELIVMAHLEPGSIHYVENAGGLPEHHATLVITETLKGGASAAKIPVILHYGLSALVEGKMSNPHGSANLPGSFAKGSVQILDTGGAGGGDSLVADATQDNVWLLRRRSGPYGREPGTGDLGIVDPQDIRPLADKTYLSLYLVREPEVAIRAYVAHHPDPAATRYLEHREIERILHVGDPAARVAQLMPYFERNARWGHVDEAFEGIVAAGAVAGPAFAMLFATTDHRHRTDIIGAWGRMRYTGAVDTLVSVLRTTDLYWSTQHLSGDWWNAAAGSPLTLQRQERYGDVFESVVALHKIGDRRAKPAIELTLRRWKAINFSNPQIVEECEATLRDFH